MEVCLQNIIKLVKKDKIDKNDIKAQFNIIYEVIENEKRKINLEYTNVPHYIIDMLITLFKDAINKKPKLNDNDIEIVKDKIFKKNNKIDKLNDELDQQIEIIMELLIELRDNI